jgi:hypothetical protein
MDLMYRWDWMDQNREYEREQRAEREEDERRAREKAERKAYKKRYREYMRQVDLRDQMMRDFGQQEETSIHGGTMGILPERFRRPDDFNLRFMENRDAQIAQRAPVEQQLDRLEGRAFDLGERDTRDDGFNINPTMVSSEDEYPSRTEHVELGNNPTQRQRMAAYYNLRYPCPAGWHWVWVGDELQQMLQGG